MGNKITPAKNGRRHYTGHCSNCERMVYRSFDGESYSDINKVHVRCGECGRPTPCEPGDQLPEWVNA